MLDLGAERRRFRRDHASGFPALADEWYQPVRFALRPSDGTGRRAAPRAAGESAGAGPGTRCPRALPEAQVALDSLLGPVAHQAIYLSNAWQALLTADRAPSNWELWLEQANGVDRLRNGGTAGIADEAFYGALVKFMNRHRAPGSRAGRRRIPPRLAGWNFAEAAAAADRLMPVVLAEHRWISPDELRDGLVMARLHLRDAAGARQALDTLAKFSRRPAGDLRSMLLGAYVRTLESMQTAASQPLGATPATP